MHVQPLDAIWLVPLAVSTGVLINSDQHTMTQALHINASGQSTANNISNAGIVALGAIPAGAYTWSLFNRTPQARETGLLAGEAVANGLVVNQALKFVFRRDRPLVNDSQGKFFNSALTDSSFPSNHATAAWAMAAVVGEEYPGWLPRLTVYGLATTVSISRILAYQHFPSDVLVGSATGWLIGHYVYRTHHNYSLTPFSPRPEMKDYLAHLASPPTTSSSASASNAVPALQQSVAGLPPDPISNRHPLPFDPDPDTIGSTNVPMDSWIYPALERLGSMGLIPTQNVGIRPWTRQECLRQLRQAEELAERPDGFSSGLVAEAHRLITDLHHELADEPASYAALSWESAYARYGTIAGPALADSYHFGQTWWNDFGRPLGRGSSFIAGLSYRAHYGRLFFYDRQELQHSPGNPAESPETNALINTLDQFIDSPMIVPVSARAAYDRQRPIELYGGVAFAGNALSLGKQELYWGPTTMGPLALSSNAEPNYNLRFVSTRPHPLPFFPSLGTYRFDLVLGKLSGHSYPARPWYNGQKASFNFGDYLEIGFTRWSVFWGEGHPITLHSFKENLFSFNSTGSYVGNGAAPFGDRNDPGDRKSNFDFRYKLPFLRKASHVVRRCLLGR